MHLKSLRESVWGMSECYIQLGKESIGLSRELKNAIEANYSLVKNIDSVNYALVKSYYVLKEYNKLVKLMENLPVSFQAEQAAESTFMLAESYYNLGNFSEALKYYAKIVLVYSSYQLAVDSYYKAGLCYEKLGDYKKAKEIYQDFVQKYPDLEYSKEIREKLKQ